MSSNAVLKRLATTAGALALIMIAAGGGARAESAKRTAAATGTSAATTAPETLAPRSGAAGEATRLTEEADGYMARAQYSEAESLYRSALDIEEKNLGADHPEVAGGLNNLARLYSRESRYAEAESLYQRALRIWETALGPGDPEVAVGVNNLAALYEEEGRYADAEPLLKRAFEIDRKAFGADHPQVATDLNNLAMLYDDQGRYAEAEPPLKQALAIDEKALGPDHPALATDLSNLALLDEDRGRYAEVEPTLRRALAIDEKALGPDHPAVATIVNNLALLYEDQGRYADAEPLYKRALAIREKALGPDNRDVAMSLNNLAGLHWQQGRYADAEGMQKQALAIREKTLGPNHPDVATDLDNLAVVYGDQGRYAEAEPLESRALAIRKQQLGSDHRAVAKSLDGLAGFYADQGRYAEAEPLYKQALAIREKVLGPDHPVVPISLNNLGVLYRLEGRYAEAEPLHKRALSIDRAVLGPDHPEVATDLNNLALLYADQGRYAEAEPLYKQALAIREKILGPDHPDVALSLGNLAGLYLQENHYADAEPLYRRALQIDEKAFGPNHPDVATTARNLAALYWQEGRYADAEPLFERALTIRRKIFGPDHPDVAEVLAQLAEARRVRGDLRGARELFERSRQTMLAVRKVNAGLGQAGLSTLLKPLRTGLIRYLSLLATIARDARVDTGQTPASTDAFAVAEQLRGGAAQTAMAQAGARAAAGDPAIAAQARRVQDLSAQYDAASKRLDVEYSKPARDQDAALLQKLQLDYDRLGQALKTASAELYTKFPKYAELVAPDPITVEEAQRLIRPDEALISYFTLDDRVLAWLVRPGKDVVYRDIAMDRNALNAMISRLRASVESICDTAGAHCRLSPFDVADAYTIYSRLLQPFQGGLAGARHLIIVPDDTLLPVPFAALITSTGGPAYQELAEDYRKGLSPSPKEFTEDYTRIAWLLDRDFAINQLPSATALRMLRREAGSAIASIQSEPFLGIGDPAFGASADCGAERGGQMVNACAPDVVRHLCPLPGAGPELVADAEALGADRGNTLFTGSNATRSTVMNLNGTGRLGHARVIAFATHALTAGSMEACTEPALVLTPVSDQGSSALLSVEDILGFKLPGAQWVILSACNTGESASKEGFSGLVRAFFYAGAPSLLVSQWSVDDAATRQLMSRVLGSYASRPEVSRAEALQEGMRAMLTQDSRSSQAYFAHPSAWAAFLVVGEGGR